MQLRPRWALLPVLAAMLSSPFALAGCEDRERPARGGPVAGWPAYGGDPGGQRYSPLREITAQNVADLEVVWEYHTGDVPGVRPGARRTAFQATPILDAGTLYFCSPLSRLFAIDAETGAEHWVFDAGVDLDSPHTLTCRGVALWKEDRSDRARVCARRVFMGTTEGELVAVDADSGQACMDFGAAGRVDLLAGLGPMEPREAFPTSPPLVVGDVVMIGSLVADNRRIDPPGGPIRGYDVRTGALRWVFDPAPPGTPPLSPGPDGAPRFHRATPNAWSIFSADPARGLAFVPFGNPSPDFFGGHRRGFDHYGTSVVALDAASGRPVWHFQTVHHDLWDYDVASQPILIELPKDGARVPAVVQATKMGHVFLLHRETGEPIYPVEERPVPASDVPGETASQTQPFPTFPPPLHDAALRPEDAWGLTPWDRGHCRKQLEALRNDGIFTPPSLEGSVLYPGTAGGFNWGSPAFDPERGLLVLAMNRIAQRIALIPRDEAPATWRSERPRGVGRQSGTPYYARIEVLVSPLGAPCSPPPWGTLLAVDLRTGEKRWEVPLGTVRDLLPVPLPLSFGLPHMGGPLVTASGLVFIGASMDDYIRAFDVETGEELWRHRLPAGGQATPMTYRVREDGRQLVVIAAGGHATLGTRLGDSLMAFALP